MNDFMYEPRCPKCKDVGWLGSGDMEYPCDCRGTDSDYCMTLDFEDEDLES